MTLEERLEDIITNISNKNQQVKNAVKHVEFKSTGNYDQNNELIIYYFFTELTNVSAFGYQITNGNGYNLNDKTISWSEFINVIDKNPKSTFKINAPLPPFDDDNSKFDSILNTEI